MLTGQNGILTNATNANSSSVYYGAEEQVKLAYMSVRTEIMAQKVANSTYDATQNTGKLAKIVRDDLNGTGWEVLPTTESATGDEITITYRNTKIYKDTIEAGKPRENGQVVYTITLEAQNAGLVADNVTIAEVSDEGSSSGSGSGSGGGQTAGITGVDFGTGKTKDTVAQGDTITITFGEGVSAYTEQFMMLTKANNQIVAMPYYNITKSTTDPRQVASGTGTLAFSGSQFWTEKGANIEPMSSSNIQTYIDAYSKKLKLVTGGTESGGVVTGGKVTATVGRRYGTGIDNISSFIGQSNSESKKLLNPSGTGYFWLGSSYSDYANIVYFVNTGGSIDYSSFGSSGTYGVRPVILIDIS